MSELQGKQTNKKIIGVPKHASGRESCPEHLMPAHGSAGVMMKEMSVLQKHERWQMPSPHFTPLT